MGNGQQQVITTWKRGFYIMHNALPIFVSCTTPSPFLYHVQRLILLVVNLSYLSRDDTCFMFVVSVIIWRGTAILGYLPSQTRGITNFSYIARDQRPREVLQVLDLIHFLERWGILEMVWSFSCINQVHTSDIMPPVDTSLDTQQSCVTRASHHHFVYKMMM